jgi:hypothetical protein
VRTKSRLVVILAALSLLIAMLPTAFAGAATGAVTLDATYYSDINTFNVVTINVNDADLSSVRTGTMRVALLGAAAGNTNPFLLTGVNVATQFAAGVLEGELAKQDKFNGDGAALTFTLTKVPRDANADGANTDADVVVKVGGTTIIVANYAVNFATRVVTFTAGNAPATGTDNVTMDYEYSEYDQTAVTTTPVRLSGSTVKFGATFPTATSEIAISIIDNATGKVTITANIAGNVAATDSAVITFLYDVLDTKTKNVTLSSNTSIAGGKNRELTGTETTASSGIFQSKVALFTAADLGKIESESSDASNDTGVNVAAGASDGVQTGELNNTAGLGAPLQTRLELAAVALGMTEETLATTVLKQILSVADGDTITATYVDANPVATVTKTATADLAAPSVTLSTPTDKIYTNDTLSSLIVDVVDGGVGVDQASITLVPPTGVAGTSIKQPILNGFKVSFAPNGAIAEGAKTWFIALKDKVGNIPAIDDAGTALVNEGIRGAAPHGSATATNAFQFTVDTSGPTVSTASTGFYLKNAGVITGATQEEQKSDSKTWVRVVFALGTGTAPLDVSTVSITDFRVAGVEPLQAIVNSKAHAGADAVAKEAGVYLEVASQATDARPKVELVGEVADMAGNVRTAGTISAASDKLSPELTISVSAPLSEKKATITVTSTEALVINPTINVTITKPAASVTANLVAQTVTATGTKSWTAVFTNPAAAATEQWVVVSGADVPGNAVIAGDDAPLKDLTSFEVDDANPTVAFKDAGGVVINAASDLEEGAIWLVSVFDEDEYTGDSFKKVTVSEMKLKVKDGATITENLADLFTSDSISYTLAVNLTPGTYNLSIKAKDDMANEVSSNTDFDVIAKAKFSLVMKPGVNLVSIPGSPVGDGGNINVLLKDLPVTSVVTYDRASDVAGSNPWLTATKDAETGLFTGDITVFEPGRAYFVTATASTTAKILIETPSMVLPPTIPLLSGFNAIGFWSIEGAANEDIDDYLQGLKWTIAYEFDPTPGVGWTVIRPNEATAANGLVAQGKGYLIYVTADGTLTP